MANSRVTIKINTYLKLWPMCFSDAGSVISLHIGDASPLDHVGDQNKTRPMRAGSWRMCSAIAIICVPPSIIEQGKSKVKYK